MIITLHSLINHPPNHTIHSFVDDDDDDNDEVGNNKLRRDIDQSHSHRRWGRYVAIDF